MQQNQQPTSIPLYQPPDEVSPFAPTEIVRLSEESWLFSKAMEKNKSPFAGVPKEFITELQSVLDVSCGPGDWALDAAFRFPNVEVVGVDFNTNIISYARARARAQRLKNLIFQQMIWTEGLDFLDGSFDFINGRLLVMFLQREKWPFMLQEALRILRPGGMIRLIDFDIVMSSSIAFETMQAWTIKTLHRAGFCFSPTERSFGASTALPSMLRHAGFQNVTYAPHYIDFSAGTEDWGVTFRNVEIACTSLMPLVVQQHIAPQEEVDKIYRQLLIDMMSDTFSGIWPFFCVTGVKPS